jgi:hypothetical protein
MKPAVLYKWFKSTAAAGKCRPLLLINAAAAEKKGDYAEKYIHSCQVHTAS